MHTQRQYNVCWQTRQHDWRLQLRQQQQWIIRVQKYWCRHNEREPPVLLLAESNWCVKWFLEPQLVFDTPNLSCYWQTKKFCAWQRNNDAVAG
jgi:hypothetical protein